MTEYSDNDRNRLYRSTLYGAGTWTVLLIVLAFMPLLPKTVPPREFPSVRIMLTPPETAEMAQASAKPDKSASRPDVPAKATGKTTAAKAAPTSAKPVSKSSAAKSSPAGLGIPNFSSPVTSSAEAARTPEQLDFTSTTETARPAAVNSGVPVPELEGSAAQILKSEGTGTVVSGTTNGTRTAAAGSAVSASTARALGDLAQQAQNGLVSGGRVAPGTAPETADGAPQNTVSSISGLDFEGTPRALVFPQPPVINLPPNLEKLVDSDRTVTVQFTVRPDGTVPGGLVTFTDSVLLPQAVRDYLRTEFSRWLFARGTQDGHASFRYSIKVK